MLHRDFSAVTATGELTVGGVTEDDQSTKAPPNQRDLLVHVNEAPAPSTLVITGETVWWYSVKSVGLAAALAALAYMIGREHGRR